MAGVFASGLMIAGANAQITTVFYILLENRCWTDSTADQPIITGTNPPVETTSGGHNAPAQIKGSTSAPFLNALVTPNSVGPAGSYYALNSISPSAQVSYCNCYHNSGANTLGTNGLPTSASVHPSEPNYVWMEAGNNLSKGDDNEPFGTGQSVSQIANFLTANPSFSNESFSSLLQNAGFTWKSYSEGVNQFNTAGANFNNTSNTGTTTGNGTLDNTGAGHTGVLPSSLWTVPLASFSGTSTSYVNPYNGTHQFNFACKHTGQLFFPATNGSSNNVPNFSTTNPMAQNYPPLNQLAVDLANNTCANYNVITPDQFNDMHTALGSAFTYAPSAVNNFFGNGVTYTAGSDQAQIAQGDNFCAAVVPQIIASPVYQAGHAAIVIWTDETEGTNLNDYNHTLTEIVISPYCKGNAFASNLNYDHSTDINTWQKVFGVVASTPTGFLNGAANPSNTSGSFAGVGNGTGALGWGTGGLDGMGQSTDLSDLFVTGTIPATLPGLSITPSGYVYNRRTNTENQTVTVTNVLSTAISTPIYLVLGQLSGNTSLINKTGTTTNTQQGSPYITVSMNGLQPGASVLVTLQFSPPTSGVISNNPFVITTSSAP
jgi:hypothetical protein